MTYKLNPIVGLFLSPIVLRFGESNAPDRHFLNGAQLAEETFDKNYLLESVSAQGEQIILTIKENTSVNTINWIGEEMVSFF